jgi:hypothetical protein
MDDKHRKAADAADSAAYVTTAAAAFGCAGRCGTRVRRPSSRRAARRRKPLPERRRQQRGGAQPRGRGGGAAEQLLRHHGAVGEARKEDPPQVGAQLDGQARNEGRQEAEVVGDRRAAGGQDGGWAPKAHIPGLETERTFEQRPEICARRCARAAAENGKAGPVRGRAGRRVPAGAPGTSRRRSPAAARGWRPWRPPALARPCARRPARCLSRCGLGGRLRQEGPGRWREGGAGRWREGGSTR